MKSVTAFMASDGQLFQTEEQATEYETSLLWTNRIQEFCKHKVCPYPSGAQFVMMRKSIIAWELFKASA